ncbi:MAG: bifunctional precorrin-2 dehydrogenase/sirohydrochlorin ferrochelatase [Aquificae bacterium]|nr:bifunctional precorrin-2 dehydrogenase/sirohydrochlorin ferrochelatase [Aquificota bacterium]
MAYFPLFVDLSDKKVLVVGGGKVATRKVKNLLRFTGHVTVVSPKVSPAIKKLTEEGKVRWIRRRFRPVDLKGTDLVIVAVDDRKLHERIYRLCRKRKILCNSVDSPEYCSFIFPSFILRGDLVVGLSSSGKVPALSRALREKLEEILPQELGELLYELEEKRKEGVRGKELLELARKRLGELFRSRGLS